MPLQEPPAGGGRTGSRFEPGPFGSRFGTRLEGCFALAERARARGCVCACAAARRGEARGGAARRGGRRRRAVVLF
ncbi:hypothetical protein EMIHUDRAFT_364224, partial [Emiliania huxleyi CCMP1516]|uniref:Uncharacterized protein n=2 Tax=Emiliania huxleyi TaxID=2903 RepID=A0A0D3KAX7_EMIH1